MRAGKDHFGVRVFDLQQRSNFPLKGSSIADLIRYLDIYFLAAADCHKINFFFIENPGIYLISSAQQFHRHDIFQHPAVIKILCAELSIAEGRIAEIILIVAGKILFPLDVISSDPVKCKRIAKILYISNVINLSSSHM